MYGKFFASTFTGSMYGAGADVFAVWAYVIANTHDSQVELNPRLLAASIGMTADRAEVAIAYLAAPDTNSRSKVSEGRRLIREGEFAYHVPNFAAYRRVRNEEDRREYNRVKKAEERQRRADVKTPVNDCQRLSSVSAKTETETEAEAEAVRNGHPPKPVSHDAAALLAIVELRAAVWTAGYDGTRSIMWEKVAEHHRERVRAAWLASGWSVVEFDAGKDFGNSKKFTLVYGAAR